MRGPFGPALFLASRSPLRALCAGAFRNLIARRLTGPEAARSAHPCSRQLMLPRNSTAQSVGFKRIRAAMSLHWRRLRELFVRECHVLPSRHDRGLGRIVCHRHGVGRDGRLRWLWLGWARAVRLCASAALRFRRLRRLWLACSDLCAARLCASGVCAGAAADCSGADRRRSLGYRRLGRLRLGWLRWNWLRLRQLRLRSWVAVRSRRPPRARSTW